MKRVKIIAMCIVIGLIFPSAVMAETTDSGIAIPVDAGVSATSVDIVTSDAELQPQAEPAISTKSQKNTEYELTINAPVEQLKLDSLATTEYINLSEDETGLSEEVTEQPGNATEEVPDAPVYETGLYNVDGAWVYYENGIFTEITSVVKRPDNGKWYYVENGVLSRRTGLVTRLSDGKELYVEKGRYKKATGMVKSTEDGKWYYVAKGKFSEATGMVKRLDTGKWYYVKNGKLKKSTGVVKRLDNGKWYYVNQGKFQKLTGVATRLQDGKQLYLTNGKLDRTFSGTFRENETSTLYEIKKGVVKNTFTVSPLATTSYISKNYREREDFSVKYIIIHHMAGRLTGEQCAQYFINNSVGTSANYCIGYDGDISCSVPEDRGGVTSGNPDADKQAITIEVSDTAYGNWRIPQAAQDSLVQLLADIAARYPSFNGKIIYDTGDEARIAKIKAGKANWNKIRGNILLHKWVTLTGTGCPEWHMIKILPSLCKKANKLLP